MEKDARRKAHRGKTKGKIKIVGTKHRPNMRCAPRHVAASLLVHDSGNSRFTLLVYLVSSPLLYSNNNLYQNCYVKIKIRGWKRVLRTF